MAKRHSAQVGNLESIVERIQELVLANSGEDAFEEIFKLLVAKIFSEMYPSDYLFYANSSSSVTANNINGLLAKANEKWKGILPEPYESRLLNEHLTICIESLQNHHLLDTNLEILDAAFECLINRAAKGSKGQYFTPRYVIDCCIKMINPSKDDIILDPACGSGGFLIHALNHVIAKDSTINVAEYSRKSLWGCDFDYRAIRVARALMLISGCDESNLFRINSLLTPMANATLFNSALEDSTPRITIEDITRTRLRGFKGFDIIVTNPPFAGEIKEANILDTYDLNRGGKRIERDVLFIERCVNLLRPGGRIAIVLPHNKFSSSTWTYMREWLMRQLRIVGVLGLARNTFLPHTHQKANVLLAIKREKPLRKQAIPDEHILFLINEKDGKDSRGQIIQRPDTSIEDPAWIRADHDLSDLSLTFHKFVKEQCIEWGLD